MYISNATLQELVREAEETQNELALRLHEKVKNNIPSEDQVVITRSEAKRAEIFEWAVNATNDPLKTFTLELLKAVFDAKGGKRKTLEAIRQFRLCCETDIMADEAELLEHFVNDVPDKFEAYVK